MTFFKFIRYKNLLLIALTQILVHYGFLKALDLPTALSDLNFFILSLATLFIAAAGYIINDIQDVAIDRINKPNKTFIPAPFSQNRAFNYYLVLNISGVGLGFLLSYRMGFGNFATLFVLISALLYVYANFLKRVLLLGNLIVSVIVASAIGIVMVFDAIPVLQGNEQQLVNPLSVLKDYAVFALMLNFLREIIKDIEDANGDYAAGIQSLPIVLGLERTAKLSAYIAVTYIFTVLGYIYVYLQANVWISLYLVIAIVIPLVFFCIKARYAEKHKHFSFLSKLLKLIMLLGIISLGVLTLTLKY